MKAVDEEEEDDEEFESCNNRNYLTNTLKSSVINQYSISNSNSNSKQNEEEERKRGYPFKNQTVVSDTSNNKKHSDSDSEDKKRNDTLEEVFHDALDFIPSDSMRNPNKKHVQVKVARGEEEEELKECNEVIVEKQLPAERDTLPYYKDPKVKISIWTIIKDSIGKDITKMSVPVYFNDPTNILQKCATSMEYNSLLDQALL